jgi:hypothetical protein
MPMSVRLFFPLYFHLPKSLALLILNFHFVSWLNTINIQIALVPNQSPLENLTPAKVALIKKLVLLPPKALTQVQTLPLSFLPISLLFLFFPLLVIVAYVYVFFFLARGLVGILYYEQWNKYAKFGCSFSFVS